MFRKLMDRIAGRYGYHRSEDGDLDPQRNDKARPKPALASAQLEVSRPGWVVPPGHFGYFVSFATRDEKSSGGFGFGNVVISRPSAIQSPDDIQRLTDLIKQDIVKNDSAYKPVVCILGWQVLQAPVHGSPKQLAPDEGASATVLRLVA